MLDRQVGHLALRGGLFAGKRVNRQMLGRNVPERAGFIFLDALKR